jgi:hypothetical protein
MALRRNRKLVFGGVLFLLSSLCAFGSVARPAEYTGDYWSPTLNYSQPGQIVELESTETLYISLQGPPGFSNIGYSPDLNPQAWAVDGGEGAVQEPGTLLMIGSGLLGIWAHRKRQMS